MEPLHPSAAVPAACGTMQEVIVAGSGGLPLRGTLQRPPAAPAFLILQGSGPVNRDGNVPSVLKTDLEKQIAEILAEAGIASLRCDKRGEYANKLEKPADENELTAFLDWENLVGDAVAAWRFLREQPGLDRRRIGLFGHSEGGIIALAAARELCEAGDDPAALILAATPGRPMGQVLHEQIARVMQRRGVEPAAAARLLQTLDDIQAEIARTCNIPDAVPDGLKMLYRPELAAYWHKLLRVDPAALAKQFPGPVLIVEGTADIQVSARDDALTLDAALSERAGGDHALLLAPRVDHELKPVAEQGQADEAAPMPPSLSEGITGWLNKTLFAT